MLTKYYALFFLFLVVFWIDYLTHRKVFFPINTTTNNSKRNLYVMLVY